MVKRKRGAASKETKEKSCSGYPPQANIPHEVILLILEKLGVKTLMRFTCVSKLWYDSIMKDQRFIKSHFIQSLKNPNLIFNFLPKRRSGVLFANEYHANRLYYLEKDEFVDCKANGSPYLHQLAISEKNDRKNLIGNYSGGLACFGMGKPFVIRSDKWSYFFTDIINFAKHEKLRILSRFHTPGEIRFESCDFGYDCLSNKYKLVCSINDVTDRRRYFILTLGSSDAQLWRELTDIPAIPQGYLPRTIQCIKGVLYWRLCDWYGEFESHDCARALLSFDLHEEKFQVIKLPDEFDPYFTQSLRLLKLEYKGSLCFARIRESEAQSGVVEFYILKDRIEQVWVKETVTFDFSVTISPSTNDYKTCTTFSFDEDDPSIATIRIVQFTGKVFLYWGKLLLDHRGRSSRIIQFYDLQSRKFNQVRVGSRCGYNYHVSNLVENLISLKTWATEDGDGELGRNDDKNTVRMIEDMFKHVPASPASFSFFSSLGGKP